MSLKIVVCVKQVPEIADVKINPKTGTLIREGVPSILNPIDEFAIEEALRIKEKYGGEISAISMGPPQAADVLKRALAMGVDRAYLIADLAFAGADTLSTAYALAKVIEMLGGIDLVVCGKQATDGDTGQVGPGIACRLKYFPLTYVSKVKEIDQQNKKIVVERFLETGWQTIRAPLPSVITVVKDINTPRSPSISKILKAQKTEIPVLKPENIPGLDKNKIGFSGSPTKVLKVFSPESRKKGEVLKGEISQVVSVLADKLMKTNIIKTQRGG